MTKISTSLVVLGVAFVWLNACGGKSVHDGNASGGAQSTAGAPNAGSGGNGAGAGSPIAGAPSAGAPSMVSCDQPEDPGGCGAAFPAYWHNARTGLCEPFTYGGCQGNGNRFTSREECMAQCPGGGSNWGACKADADCVIQPAGCCQACDPVDDQALIAINAKFAQTRTDSNCASSGVCAPCEPPPGNQTTSQFFKAVCASGQCSVLDVRTDPKLTGCASDGDCELRDGVGCCAGCDGAHFVGVKKGANFCDVPQGCDACVAEPSTSMGVSCRAGVCTYVNFAQEVP